MCTAVMLGGQLQICLLEILKHGGMKDAKVDRPLVGAFVSKMAS